MYPHCFAHSRQTYGRLALIESPVTIYQLVSKTWRSRKRQEFRCPTFSERMSKGFFFTTYPAMRKDRVRFFKYFRMSTQQFDFLVELAAPHFPHKRQAGVSVEESVAVTVRYLASGDYQCSLAVAFCIPFSTICGIIHETLEVLWAALQRLYLPEPTVEQLKAAASEFWLRWNMPNTCGALDGKHIMVEKPAGAGSAFRNYKDRDSIVLMAVADGRYRFSVVDIGEYGSRSDGGIFSKTTFCKGLESGQLMLPSPCFLPCSTNICPHFLVADDAFGLRTWLMKPYSGLNLSDDQLVFNYRLSRSRRVVENTFGILAARWRIFRRPIQADVTTVDLITRAACCLHNYLMSDGGFSDYCPLGFVDRDLDGDSLPGQWREVVASDVCSGMRSLPFGRGHRLGAEASEVRDLLKEFFLTPAGAAPCPWQLAYVRRGRV